MGCNFLAITKPEALCLIWLGLKTVFLPLVKDIWCTLACDDPIDVLNIKIKRFKKYFKGRGSNLFGHNKKRA